jgi:Lysine methyltransferase
VLGKYTCGFIRICWAGIIVLNSFVVFVYPSLIFRLGCFGVAISFIYHNLRRHNSISRYGSLPSVTITDLQEALPLIRHNYQLNMPPTKVLDENNQQQLSSPAVNQSHPFVSITPLRWGHQGDSQKVTALKPIDYLIASDVLYDPSKSSSLLQTLIHLSSPGITTVYLVYKKRALKREEEEAFFMGCSQHFDLSVMPEYPNDIDTELCRDESSVDGSTWLGCDVESTLTPNHIQTKQFGVVVYLMKRR